MMRGSMTATDSAEITPQCTQDEAVLQKVFGYHSYRDGQKEIIDAAITGHDSLVIMQPAVVRASAIKFLRWCATG